MFRVSEVQSRCRRRLYAVSPRPCLTLVPSAFETALGNEVCSVSSDPYSNRACIIQLEQEVFNRDDCSDMICQAQIRGHSMSGREMSCQIFRGKTSRDLLAGVPSTEQGLLPGAGLDLVKLFDPDMSVEARRERAWTFLAIAFGGHATGFTFDRWHSAARHWQAGDKSLAAIYLAQGELGKLDEAGAERLSLAVQLLDAGVDPRWLRRELGVPDVGCLGKYDPDQPRVPAGSGRESGQWTSGGGAASTLVEGRSGAENSSKVKHVHTLPEDAIVVQRPDGTTIYDPDSETGKLMAPPRANFREVYAAGQQLASHPIWEHYSPAATALEHFGTYDFQRDKATNTHYRAYVDAANYAVGVFMAGAGYGVWETLNIAQAYALLNSSNRFEYKGKAWTLIGWEDAHSGAWR